MPTFTYTAIDARSGRETRGSIAGPNALQATAELKAQGLFPTQLQSTAVAGATGAAGAAQGRERHGRTTPPSNARAKRPLGWRRRGGAGRKTRMLFTRQLSTLLQAGMPLLRGLEVLARQQPEGPFRETVEQLAVTIRGGGSLSAGIAQFPRCFNRLYLNMVRAGEAAGALDVVLARLAGFLEKSQRIRGKVQSALVYPLIIMVVAGCVLAMLILFVIPRFEGIFANMLKGQPLPALTQVVVGLSRWAQHHFLWAGGVAGLVVLAAVAGLRTARGARFADQWALRLPLVGDLARKAAVARFTRTLGTLLVSGVQILDALRITRDTAGNQVIAEAIDLVHERVKAGEDIARPLGQTGVFPEMVPSMIEVGEETGKLPEMLERVAETYDEEVDQAVAALTSLLEPLMIVVMAVVVGTIVIALFLPMVRIFQALS